MIFVEDQIIVENDSPLYKKMFVEHPMGDPYIYRYNNAVFYEDIKEPK